MTDIVARELGYGRFEAVIDEASWIPVEVRFDDARLQPLKTITVHSVAAIDGIWTPERVSAINHRTEHSTEFLIRDTDYSVVLDPGLFEPTGLSRGLGGLDSGE